MEGLKSTNNKEMVKVKLISSLTNEMNENHYNIISDNEIFNLFLISSLTPNILPLEIRL